MIDKSKTEVTVSTSVREKPDFSGMLIIILGEPLHLGEKGASPNTWLYEFSH